MWIVYWVYFGVALGMISEVVQVKKRPLMMFLVCVTVLLAWPVLMGARWLANSRFAE